MRIAHLDTGRTWRGGQGQVLLLMRALRSRGHAQRLLAPAGPLAEKAGAEGFDVTAWESHGELDVAAAMSVRAALVAFAPDVVHAHSAHAHALGVPAARLARVPTVVVSRRVDFRVGTNPVSRLKYRFRVDRYLCISEGVRDAMRASGVPDSRLVVVPSGVDFGRLEAEASGPAPDLRGLLGVPAEAEVVGTVASLAPHKNHALLLEAAALIARARPATHFAWLGEGECRPALERRRRALGLQSRVHLLGFRPDARALMRQFTLFALSSSLEGLCTSLLDAQSLGVPIVATAVGGVPEVIDDDRTGRLVRALTPESLAASLAEALDQPERRARWVLAARESVRRFDIERTAELTLAAYRGAALPAEPSR